MSILRLAVNVPERHEHSRPGKHCFWLKNAILDCYTALLLSLVWVSCVSGRTSCTSRATKASAVHKHETHRNASKRNKAQLHGPSVRSFQELWLAQHTVPAHPKRIIFRSSTLELNKTRWFQSFNLNDLMTTKEHSHSIWMNKQQQMSELQDVSCVSYYLFIIAYVLYIYIRAICTLNFKSLTYFY